MPYLLYTVLYPFSYILYNLDRNYCTIILIFILSALKISICFYLPYYSPPFPPLLLSLAPLYSPKLLYCTLTSPTGLLNSLPPIHPYFYLFPLFLPVLFLPLPCLATSTLLASLITLDPDSLFSLSHFVHPSKIPVKNNFTKNTCYSLSPNIYLPSCCYKHASPPL